MSDHTTSRLLVVLAIFAIGFMVTIMVMLMDANAKRVPRCKWCGVKLRWWQFYWCRVCSFFMRWNYPSPPCRENGRRLASPDRFFGVK